MKKETYEKEDWFIRFLRIFMVHASYWVIITLLIRYINAHGQVNIKTAQRIKSNPYEGWLTPRYLI